VTLTVTDNGGATAVDTVVVTISPNQAPIANAGADQTVTDLDNTGIESVTLNGNASTDPDGTITGFAWSEGGLALGTGAILSHGFAVGPHTVTLTVTDNGGATATANLTVTILPGPPPDIDPPVVSITSPTAGSTLTGLVNITASATDNDAVTQVEFLVDGVVIATDSVAPYSASWDTATVLDGAHILTARATDPSGNVGTSAAVIVTVSGPPAPPALSITLTGWPAAVFRGDQFTGSAVVSNTGGSDASGLVASLNWTPGNALRFQNSNSNANVPVVAAGGSQAVNWQLRADKQNPVVTITVVLRDASGKVLAQDTTTMEVLK
jgi:hypothetical protein